MKDKFGFDKELGKKLKQDEDARREEIKRNIEQEMRFVRLREKQIKGKT